MPAPILFTDHAARIWADVLNHLSGYMVTVTMQDGTAVTGELLGDGVAGGQLELLTWDTHRVILAASISSVTVL